MKIPRLFLHALIAGTLVASLDCYSSGPVDTPTVTHPATLTPTRRLRRLSSREYDNVVRDLLGDTTRPAQAFVVDAYQNGYDNGSAGLAVQSDQVASYQLAAEALAKDVVTRDLPRLLGGCAVDARGADACVEAFLGTFAARAYRRPLSSTEQQRLRDAYHTDAAAGFARGVQTMLEVILQSPQFLYREELGPAAPHGGAPGATVQLTDYEIASELSFLLTGTVPDDALWSAVAEGRFTTDADRRREANRLLATPGAKQALRAFLHAWLGTDRVLGLSKDPTFYPAFDTTTAASMSAELDRTYDDLLAADDGSLRRLFTSNRAYVDAPLAALYGVALPASDTGVVQEITLDPALRGGIMTRAGFLAVHADTDSSGPIARGVFVLQRIMCSPPPPPPANVPPAVPAGDPGVKTLTTRQRFDRHVSSPACAGCHTTIDGVGFGFEQFDGVGAFRSAENGQPVDSSGTLVGTGALDGPYVGATALGAKLAGSDVLTRCYVRQAYRYAMGQIEPTGVGLDALGVGFSADTKLTDLLVDLVTTPLFVNRTFEAP